MNMNIFVNWPDTRTIYNNWLGDNRPVKTSLTKGWPAKQWLVLLLVLLANPAHAFEAGLEKYGKDQGGVRHVNATEAGLILENYPTVKVLDVRTGPEYNRGHLSDATNINYYSFSFKKKLDKLDKNVTWLVHCRSGVRSGKSLPILKALGFESIIHLDGGIVAWTKDGLPVTKK